MNRIAICCLTLSWGLFLGLNVLQACDELDPIVEKLLVEHWEKGKVNREESKSIFRDAAATEQVLLSYTLNRMSHNRYREARIPVDELTNAFPKNLDGWVLRTWLEAVTDNYDRSLISLQRMKREMAKIKDLDATRQDELYGHAARIVGYLQGPVTGKVNQATLNATLVKVVDGMTPEQLKKFNDERSRILDQYDQLVKESGTLQQTETQKAENAAKVEIAAIDTQNKAIDARRQQIQPDMNRLQQELDQKVSAVDARLSPLQQELAGLVSSINALEFALQDVFREQVIQRGFLFNENDPFIRALIRDRLIQLDFEATNIQGDLFNTRARANSIALQADNLAAERLRVRQDYSARLNQLGDEVKQNDRQQRRNVSRLQELAKGPQTSPKVRVANVQINALTTYSPFPLEMFRQDYIDSLTGN